MTAHDRPIGLGSGYSMDLLGSELVHGDMRIKLTNIELRIIKILIENMGKLVNFRDLIRAGWGEKATRQEYGFDVQELRVYMTRIRKKISGTNLEIVAISRKGYMVNQLNEEVH